MSLSYAQSPLLIQLSLCGSAVCCRYLWFRLSFVLMWGWQALSFTPPLRARGCTRPTPGLTAPMRIAESEVLKSAFKIENKNYPSVHGI